MGILPGSHLRLPSVVNWRINKQAIQRSDDGIDGLYVERVLSRRIVSNLLTNREKVKLVYWEGKCELTDSNSGGTCYWKNTRRSLFSQNIYTTRQSALPECNWRPPITLPWISCLSQWWLDLAIVCWECTLYTLLSYLHTLLQWEQL